MLLARRRSLPAWRAIRSCAVTKPDRVPAAIAPTLYICAMSRSATLPPIHVTPETKASLEAVLRDGESLTQFIEAAVRQEAEFRAQQRAAVARAEKALRAADKGVGLTTTGDLLAGMQQRAEAAQQRIRAAVAARNDRTAG